MTDKLLSCPFCGDEYKPHIEGHVKVTETAKSGPRYGVRCYTCGGSVSFFDTEAEAIAAWNTRIERTCHVINTNIRMVSNVVLPYVRFDCCGFETIETRTMSYCPNCGAKVVS